MSQDLELSPDANVDELQARLEEREHLVRELTSRLEQAAEQLDRFRRTGAGRGGHVIGGSLPAELVEEQRALAESLQEAVQQWEEMQPTMLLSRIEMQVSEIRDLIVNGGGGIAAGDGKKKSLVDHLFSAAGEESPIESGGFADDDDDAESESAPSGLSTYELFKAGLSADEPAEKPKKRKADKPAEQDSPVAEADDDDLPDFSDDEVASFNAPVVDAPDEIDLENASVEDLRAAVEDRDSYITYLLCKLRVAETNPKPVGNWAELENVPDELRTRLEEYEARMEEQLRLAEIETSMERARLGREASRLESWEEQLNKKATQLGMTDDATEDGEEMTPKKRRWLRMFGKK